MAQSEIQKHIKALGGEDEEVRDAATDALSAIGKPAVPALIEALKHESTLVRLQAAGALGGIGPDARAAVLALLHPAYSDYDEVRYMATWALGMIGSRTAVDTLVDKLKDGEWHVRLAATWGLGSIGGKTAVAALFETLCEVTEVVDVREAATNALREIGKPAVIHLIKALKNRDEWVRLQAAEALGDIGPDAREAVPALREALEDNDWAVRRDASAALKKIKKIKGKKA